MNDFFIPPEPGTEADLIADEIRALPPETWISPRGEDMGDAGISTCTGEYDADPTPPNLRSPGLIWTYILAGEWLSAYDQAA
ncbi:MAG: hypothetical protein ACR2HF_13905 [Methylococcaceae bacterium]